MASDNHFYKNIASCSSIETWLSLSCKSLALVLACNESMRTGKEVLL